MIQNTRIYTIVFIASTVSLSFEITLTRIFSISLWHHFAFMVISIAMMGLALSGTFLSIFPKLKSLSNLSLYGFFLGISISAGYLISNQIPFDPVKFQWSKAQFLLIGCYYLVLLVPFFFTGLIIASAYHSISKKSGILYGFDLLGAGIGSVGILFLLKNLSPERVILLLSAVALITIPFTGTKSLKLMSILSLLIIVLLMVYQPAFVTPRISPFKEMPQALRYPNSRHITTIYDPFSRIDIFSSPAVRFAPGLSLKYLHPLPSQIGCSIDGDEIMAITSPDKKSELHFLSHLPQALVYEITGKKDALLIDPKGGLPTLMANYYNIRNIYNVESNALLVEVLQTQYAHFSGHIYSKNTWKGMGRSWLKSRPETFNIIDISMTRSIPSGPSGLSEDYQLTVEAFREYISHLKPEGFLSLNLYIVPPPRQSFRLLTTIIKAMEQSGNFDPALHIAAIRSWGTISILIKKTPLQTIEIEKIKNFAFSRFFDPIFYPGIQPEESSRFIKSPDNIYFNGFNELLTPIKSENFVNNYIFDISPVYDDKPFFHYFLKFRNIKKIYQLMGKKWDFFLKEGTILPFIFIQVIFFSIILIILPSLFKRKERAKQSLYWNKKAIFLYFALLGLGFMFVEIVFIQKLILILKSPLYAVSAVLASVLIGAGMGGFFSTRFKYLQRPFFILAIPVLIILYIFLLPLITNTIISLPLTIKLPLIFVTILPMGFFLGIPFPSGMKYLGEHQRDFIPWAWAINGCFSIMGPILAMMIALSYGFSGVLWVSALIYLLAFLSFFYHYRQKTECLSDKI